jgi:hypothetical protein
MSTESENKWQHLEWLKSNHPVPRQDGTSPPTRPDADPSLVPIPKVPSDTVAATGPLYSPGAVMIATLLGSPVAGAAILAINYKRLGKKRQSRLTILTGVAGTTGLIVLGFLLPEGIPSSGIAIGGVLAMRQLARGLQGSAIRKHTDRGGTMASNWKAAGIGLVGLLAMSAIILAAVWATLPGFGTRLAVSDNEEIYYSDKASLAEAQTLGQKLEEVGYFTNKHRASVFLSKNDKRTTISFVIGNNGWDDPKTIAAFRQLGNEIAPAVGGKPLTLRLMDANADVKRELPIK